MTPEIYKTLKSILLDEMNQQKGYFYEAIVKIINDSSTYTQEEIDRKINGMVKDPINPWVFNGFVEAIFRPTLEDKLYLLIEDGKTIIEHKGASTTFMLECLKLFGVDHFNEIGYKIKTYPTEQECRINSQKGATMKSLAPNIWVSQHDFGNQKSISLDRLITRLNKYYK